VPSLHPLDALAPLIAPSPVSWWPPAPGWWFLAAGLLGCLLLWRIKPWRRQRQDNAVAEAPLEPQRQIALDELAQLSKPYDGQPRSEERRVGKECRSRWWPQDSQQKKKR